MNFHHLATRKKGQWTVQEFFAQDVFGNKWPKVGTFWGEKVIFSILKFPCTIYLNPQILQKHGVTSDSYLKKQVVLHLSQDFMRIFLIIINTYNVIGVHFDANISPIHKYTTYTSSHWYTNLYWSLSINFLLLLKFWRHNQDRIAIQKKWHQTNIGKYPCMWGWVPMLFIDLFWIFTKVNYLLGEKKSILST
jgi:hypothetical protein